MKFQNILFFKPFYSRPENTVNIAGVLRASVWYLFSYARSKSNNNLSYKQFSTTITLSLALPHMHCGCKLFYFLN